METTTKILIYSCIILIGLGLVYVSFTSPCDLGGMSAGGQTIPIEFTGTLGILMCVAGDIKLIIMMMAGLIMFTAGLWGAVACVRDL